MSATSAPLPSRQRPVPLRGRADLVVQGGEFQGVGSVVVKDPVGLAYHRLHLEQHAVLELLDGRRSLDDVRIELKRRFPATAISLQDVQRLVADLHEKGLLVSLRPGQGAQVTARRREDRSRKLRESLWNVLSLRLPGWDPDRVLTALDPFVRWMFRPWGVAATVAFVLSAWALLLVRFDDFQRGLPEFREFFHGRNLVALWITLAGAKVLHEFGHGLACKRFGGECHEMGVMLLVFSPCLYCDVTDSWMLRRKSQRMIIAAAGMYVECILSALAIFVWRATSPGLLHHMALNLFFVTAVTTIVFNANPLMKLDGYYILSDWLEIPNLRQKAGRTLQQSFAWHCLGIDLPDDPFDVPRGRGWFLLFAVASTVYRWSVTFGICSFLYVVLKPYGVQSLGIVFAAASFAGFFGGMIAALYRIVSAPRSQPMSPRRISWTLTTACAAAVLAFTVPIPRNATAPFVLQPRGVRHVVTTETGQLAEVRARPGERVRAGDVLATLQSDELDDEFLSLETEREKAAGAVDRQRHRGDPGAEHLAIARRESLDARLADLRERRRQLVLVAPCDGMVIAPPHKPPPERSNERVLCAWTGSPLDPENLGCLLEERAHFLSVAPTDVMEANVLIDQADRDELRLGDALHLRFDQKPGFRAEGSILSLSLRHVDLKAERAAHGANEPKSQNAAGQSHSHVGYQARVGFPQEAGTLKPGLQGEARFPRTSRTLAGWLWRWLRQTWDATT